jgi:hypothetical protein
MTEISETAPVTSAAAAGAEGGTVTPPPPPFCGRCGEPAPSPHQACVERLALEPPRYCVQCRRRLIVQVLPTGYTARCSAHGVL